MLPNNTQPVITYNPQTGQPVAQQTVLRSNPVVPQVVPPVATTTGISYAPQVQSGVPVMPSGNDGRFAVMPDLTRNESIEARTRQFEGDGSSFLRVGGLLELDRIRINNADLPLYEDRHYPVNQTGLTEKVQEPLVAFQIGSDGGAVLIRAQISNDGIWPKGAKIFVTGQWSDMSTQPTQPTTQQGVTLPDAFTRAQVNQETGSAHILNQEGQAPVLTDDAQILQTNRVQVGAMDTGVELQSPVVAVPVEDLANGAQHAAQQAIVSAAEDDVNNAILSDDTATDEVISRRRRNRP